VKEVRESAYKELDSVLSSSFKQYRSRNVSINGSVLVEKANDLAKILKSEDFTYSRSWIQRWRERHGLVHGKITGESAAVNLVICEDWLENEWPEIRRGYNDNDILNGDEAGLFYKLTPDKTYRFQSESCAGGKLS